MPLKVVSILQLSVWDEMIAMKSEARNEKDVFEFCIEPSMSGGFNIWPSIEEAKQVSEVHCGK
jgi:hypothetical protein